MPSALCGILSILCVLPVVCLSIRLRSTCMKTNPITPPVILSRWRCAACGKPLTGRYTIADGKSYHADCYRNFVVPRCVYCNEPLMEEYMVDHWGAKYCKKHSKEYPAGATGTG